MAKIRHVVKATFLRQIGHIAVSFSVLENTMQMFAISLINEPQRIGRAITAEMPFKNLRALIVSVFIEKHGCNSDFTRLKSLVNRAGKAEEERNRVFHSGWGMDDNDHSFVWRCKETAKEKHGLRGEGKEYTPKDLKKIGDEFLQLSGEFEDLLKDFVQRGLVQDPYDRL